MGASGVHMGQQVSGAQSLLWALSNLHHHLEYVRPLLIHGLISYKSISWARQLQLLPFYSWENEAQTKKIVSHASETLASSFLDQCPALRHRHLLPLGPALPSSPVTLGKEGRLP